MQVSDGSVGVIRRPLGHQVLLGIGGFLSLLIAIVVMAIALVVNLNHRESHVNARDTVYVSAVQSVALEAKAIANDQRGYLLSGDEQFLREADGRVATVRSGFSSAISAATTISERDAATEARDGFERWITTLHGEVAAFQVGKRDAAVDASLGTDRELRKAYESSLADAQSIGVVQLHAADNSVSAAASRTVRLLLTGLLVALVIGVGIGEWLLRTIVRPLVRLVDVLYR